jgi:hypothetical protein
VCEYPAWSLRNAQTPETKSQCGFVTGFFYAVKKPQLTATLLIFYLSPF